jgi:predicted dehydrogenase
MGGAMIAPPMIVPRHVLGRGYQAPSDTLGIALVGFGGMGMSNWSQLLTENTVALCDVDFPFVERSLAGRTRPRQTPTAPPANLNLTGAAAQAWLDERRRSDARALEEGQKMQAAYTKAPKYADFREMLDKQRDIDAVVVATPDHLHAVIAARAMKAGKHVYVQKPLTYSVHEARALTRIAKENPKIVTQMGNQGHSGEGTRRINELIAAGVIGPVREVHIWTDRPLGYWAQGIPRPVAPGAEAPTPPAGPGGNLPPRWSGRTVDQAVLKLMAEQPQSPPPGLNWDLFLGPAKEVPYHPAYHPFSWRGWVDFGVSAIGDMGAHLIDQPYWALGLTYPTSINASSTPWGGSPQNPGTYPLAMTATYEFPARGAAPPVTMYWYDGGLMPPRPPFLPDDVSLPRRSGGGGVFIGDKGILVYGTYGDNPTVYGPQSVVDAAARVPKTFERVTTSHEMNWVNACKGQGKASSPFEYAAPLTEVMLLGVIALRAGEGRKVMYDGANMRVTNVPEVNQYLTREYRAGWSL